MSIRRRILVVPAYEPERDRPLGWMDHGLCAETGDVGFFPEVGEPANAVRKLCARCPVADICLEYAIENGMRGIWGGTTEHDRLKIKRKRRRAA